MVAGPPYAHPPYTHHTQLCPYPRCGRGDSDDHDDILLCDFAGCFRAYHQNCLSPAIQPGAFPEEEEDWFCWQCECLTDCLDLLEREFQARVWRLVVCAFVCRRFCPSHAGVPCVCVLC